jgi:3-oxoacyl-[acyl-carrier-protein] synthase II
MITTRTVAISGIGAVTGFGSGVSILWEALAAGRTCVGVKTAGDTEAAGGDRVAELSLSAATEAVTSAGWSLPLCDVQLAFGTNVGRVARLSRLSRNDLGRALSPGVLEEWADHHVIARTLAASLGCEVDSAVTLTGACTSGALALGYAFDFVASGQCEMALAGGADEETAFKASGHLALRTSSPSGRVRPFDAGRDGTAFREGAGFLFLESLEHCLNRGGRPLALLRGYGVGTDTGSLTAPDPEGRGAVIAMRAALADAGLAPEQIDHVQGHATGTRLNDAIEARSIRQVIGPHTDGITVSADKGAIGHTFGASGPLSAILVVLAIQKGQAPPAVGCEKPDPACSLPLVLKCPLERRIMAALCNNFGFGGGNVSLVVERYE